MGLRFNVSSERLEKRGIDLAIARYVSSVLSIALLPLMSKQIVESHVYFDVIDVV